MLLKIKYHNAFTHYAPATYTNNIASHSLVYEYSDQEQQNKNPDGWAWLYSTNLPRSRDWDFFVCLQCVAGLPSGSLMRENEYIKITSQAESHTHTDTQPLPLICNYDSHQSTKFGHCFLTKSKGHSFALGRWRPRNSFYLAHGQISAQSLRVCPSVSFKDPLFGRCWENRRTTCVYDDGGEISRSEAEP